MTSAAQGETTVDTAPMGDFRRLPRVADAQTAFVPVPPDSSFHSHTPDPQVPQSIAAPPEHNPLFGLLVESEADVTGLLAYGLYKQNKRDWLIAFQTREGRMPTSSEREAFALGERLPRRLNTYRRLAADMLATSSHTAASPAGFMAPPANDSMRTHHAMALAARKPITWTYILMLLGMLVVMAIAFRLAAAWLLGTGR
jgi:hypothetical protein